MNSRLFTSDLLLLLFRSYRIMTTYGMYERKEHQDKLDALTHQLSRASTLVEDQTSLHAHSEGREFYDTRATWTPEEESRVKLKTDVRLLGWLSIMFFGNILHQHSLKTHR
jgi:hypothetical protein